MVRTILLRLDEKMFMKLKTHKAEIEAFNGAITWEEYIKFIFREARAN